MTYSTRTLRVRTACLRPSPFLLTILVDIERIEDRRPDQKDTDAVYFLTPKPHILDCLMADFERRKYRGTFLLWTSCKDAAHLASGARTDLCPSASTAIERASGPIANGTGTNTHL